MTRQYNHDAFGRRLNVLQIDQVTEAPPGASDSSFVRFYMMGGVLYYVDSDGVSRVVRGSNTLEVQAGTGITAGSGVSYSSNVFRKGDLYHTEIIVDLTGLSSATDDLDVIGISTGPAHLGQITAARCGTIFAGTMQCLTVPASLTDIDLYSNTLGTLAFEDAIDSAGAETALLTAGAAWTAGLTRVLTAFPAGDEFLYLTNGAADTADPFTGGVFKLDLYGA